MTAMPCPCGLPADYNDCCGRFHRGDAAAPTAERLMRSRYSAFAVGDANYLLRTWHPTTRPAHLDLDNRTQWIGLDVLATTEGSAFHSTGTVAFRAHYREGRKTATLNENSRFVAENGHWLYLGPI